MREEAREEPGEQEGVQVNHDDQSDATGDERPEFVAVVTGDATTEIISDLLVPLYKSDACCQDEQSDKK